jgi:hypothetical protein
MEVKMIDDRQTKCKSKHQNGIDQHTQENTDLFCLLDSIFMRGSRIEKNGCPTPI